MREMAQEEFKTGKERIEQLDQELQILLLPKDPTITITAFWKCERAQVVMKQRFSLAIYSGCIAVIVKNVVLKWKSCRLTMANMAAIKKLSPVCKVRALTVL